MGSIALLKEKIPDFAGYGEENLRRVSDEEVRSYLGEALAGLRVRLESLPAAAQTRIDDLVLRTGFANQHAFRAFEDGARTATDFDELLSADAAVVEVADRAASIGAEGIDAYLDEVTAALDRRDRVMLAYGTARPISTSG
jgi:hypothetical protein